MLKVLLWLSVPLLETFSQIAMKLAVGTLQVVPLSAAWVAALAQSPWFLLSLVSDLCCFLCWMAILKRTQLSVAFPLSSVCFVTILLAGRIIFSEPLLYRHWVGAALIMVGIFLVGKQDAQEAS